jgi:hypothetical protein
MGRDGGEGGSGLPRAGLLCHYLMMPTILNSIPSSLLNPFMAHTGP